METNLLLKAHLKKLRLPTMLRDVEKAVAEATSANLTYERFLLGLVEQEVLQREQNTLRIRLSQARFPLIKTLDTFDFAAIPDLDRQKVLQLAQGDFIREPANVICLGNSGTGKTHLATAIGVAACRKNQRVRFFTAAGLVNELLEAKKDSRLSKLQRDLTRFDLIILDELGYIPFDETGAQLLFNFCADRYERAALLITSNLDFAQWVKVFRDEALSAALLDRLTHRCHILVMNGESFRFRQSKQRAFKINGKEDPKSGPRKAKKDQGQ